LLGAFDHIYMSICALEILNIIISITIIIIIIIIITIIISITFWGFFHFKICYFTLDTEQNWKPFQIYLLYAYICFFQQL